MSSFYVGQRVRITGNRFPHTACNNGREGTVLSGAYYQFGGLGHLVSIDGRPAPVSKGAWHVLADHMEPILPPGLESLEEINALYEPSPEQIREAEADIARQKARGFGAGQLF